MCNPKISVIIPVYNAESYLNECIDSILEQTFQDYEIVCINDGSIDNSFQILNKYKSIYPDVFRIYAQENSGQAAARNLGVSNAKGEFIAFIDADDRIDVNYLEILYTTAKSNNSELVICSYEKFDNAGNIVLRRNSKDWEVEFANGIVHVFQYSPCAKLISREMLRRYHIEFIAGEKMEDGPYGIVTNLVAKNVVTLDYFGYHYRMYSDSTMGGIRKNGISTSREERKFPLKGIEYATQKVMEIQGGTEGYAQVLEFCILKAIAGFVFVFCKRNDKSSHKEICDFAKYMVKTYFPRARKNPYIRKRIRKLPLSHWMAVKLLVITNDFHVLYLFARLYKRIFDRNN